MNRTSILLATAFAALTLTTGCQIIMPKTTLTGTFPNGGKFKWSSPQNHSLTGLKISIDTNNTVTAEVASDVAVTDPNVVTATAAGQAQLLQATANLVQISGQQAQQLGAMAAQAMATSGASLAVPKAPATTLTNSVVAPVATNAPAPAK